VRQHLSLALLLLSGAAHAEDMHKPIDIKPVIDKFGFLSDTDRRAVYTDNALTMFPRLAKRLAGASA